MPFRSLGGVFAGVEVSERAHEMDSPLVYSGFANERLLEAGPVEEEVTACRVPRWPDSENG